MRKYHDIVPKRKRFKKAIYHCKLHIWAKAFIAFTYYDAVLQEEIRAWPDGFTFLIQVLSDESYIGLRKEPEGVHIIKATQSVNNNVILLFKNLVIAHEVFSGEVAIRQAITEKKLLIRGNFSDGLSVLRCVILVQNVLFPKLADEKSLKRKIKKYFDRLKVCVEILLKRQRVKEGNSSDPEVLRIFE